MKNKDIISIRNICYILQVLRNIAVDITQKQTLFHRATYCNLTINKTMNKFRGSKLDFDVVTISKRIGRNVRRSKKTIIFFDYPNMSTTIFKNSITFSTSRISVFKDQVPTNLLSSILSSTFYFKDEILGDKIIDNNNSTVEERGQIDGCQSPNGFSKIVREENSSENNNNSNFPLESCTFSNRNEFPEQRSFGYLIELSRFNGLLNKNFMQYPGILFLVRIIHNYLNWPVMTYKKNCYNYFKGKLTCIDFKSNQIMKEDNSSNIDTLERPKLNTLLGFTKQREIDIQPVNILLMNELKDNSISESNEIKTVNNKDRDVPLRFKGIDDERNMKKNNEGCLGKDRHNKQPHGILMKGTVVENELKPPVHYIVGNSLLFRYDFKIREESFDKSIETSETITSTTGISKDHLQLTNRDIRNHEDELTLSGQSCVSSELEVNKITIDKSITCKSNGKKARKNELFSKGDNVKRELPSVTAVSFQSEKATLGSKTAEQNEDKSTQMETKVRKVDNGTQLGGNYSYTYYYPTLMEPNFSHDTLLSIESLGKESSACDSYLQDPNEDVSVEFFVPDLILSNKFVLDDMTLKPIRKDISTSTTGLNLTNKIDKAILVRLESGNQSTPENTNDKNFHSAENINKFLIDNKKRKFLFCNILGRKRSLNINSIRNKEAYFKHQICFRKKLPSPNGCCKLSETNCKTLHPCLIVKKCYYKETSQSKQNLKANRLGDE